MSVSCNSGCKISGSPDKDGYYIAEAKSGKEAFITVSAEGAELAKERFRIFPLPQPQPYFCWTNVQQNKQLRNQVQVLLRRSLRN